MGACRLCKKTAATVSDAIGFCADCIRARFEIAWPEIQKIHHLSRKPYALPEEPPREKGGVACKLCFHQCRITEGGVGYCGLRKVKNHRLTGGRPHEGNLACYFDPLPTNCVGSFVCPAGTGCGFPEYAVSEGPERGCSNLAVFYHACGFNCLYCQNHHFKTRTGSGKKTAARQLAGAVKKNTTCICYFGGDPSPQILHAIKSSILALKASEDRILRICWETNGSMRPRYLKKIAELSLNSGGLIKFDLKAWSEEIHYALCGVTNRQTLDNFQTLAKMAKQRPVPPFLIASTLLVPGYVDAFEVENIARFIADLNPDIPYNLLGFYPCFYLDDLPNTSRSHALRCKAAAENAGLRSVHIGNAHLLGKDY